MSPTSFGLTGTFQRTHLMAHHSAAPLDPLASAHDEDEQGYANDNGAAFVHVNGEHTTATMVKNDTNDIGQDRDGTEDEEDDELEDGFDGDPSADNEAVVRISVDLGEISDLIYDAIYLSCSEERSE